MIRINFVGALPNLKIENKFVFVILKITDNVAFLNGVARFYFDMIKSRIYGKVCR